MAPSHLHGVCKHLGASEGFGDTLGAPRARAGASRTSRRSPGGGIANFGVFLRHLELIFSTFGLPGLGGLLLPAKPHQWVPWCHQVPKAR